MRFLHTADWHLGRLFFGVRLIDDQAYLLDQLVAIVGETRPDAVLVAGDIYDRSVPPPEAVSLLDDVLSRLVLELRVPMILIAGNHDSPHRLAFGARLLASGGIHMAGLCSAQVAPVLLEDAHGPVAMYALPYAEPAVVREATGAADIHDHDTALRAQMAAIRAASPAGRRSILLAHAFLTGGQLSKESERTLTVGGTGEVGADAFAGFDYVALGHLHRPQSHGEGRLRYAGALMKYSFTETDHRKSVSLVEMGEDGRCRVEEIPLAPRHEVRSVSGALHDLLAQAPEGAAREDYLQVALLDTGPVLDAMARLREVYPNVLTVERPAAFALGEDGAVRTDIRTLDPATLFAEFFQQVTDEALTETQAEAFAQVTETVRLQEREAVPA